MAVTFIPSAARSVNQTFSVDEEPTSYAFSTGAGMLRLFTHKAGESFWQSGDFVDYRGIVSVQVDSGCTRLDAVANGRCHVRTWCREFGKRTIAQLCRAFLTDLHGAPGEDARRAVANG